ncbi:efflux RND transporter permease subunit, partial [Mesorhizobium japonicum]|uniref:efflux RND transporter permease subunit n=1 Tax=Mesorhizobium japonicum TaxID=2066070 RepID=UPI003B5A812F
EELPNGMTYEWTELTYQQILAGNTALFVFPLCVLLAFLVLAAQYESWSLPLAVILISRRPCSSIRPLTRAGPSRAPMVLEPWMRRTG